ncbi:MAG TPA: SPOR domain-containing protein, partial [Hyphomicrobiaceae bacterium]|nr:SPOR domain-containing protein [Hyphomicrobiaceae bacterium]
LARLSPAEQQLPAATAAERRTAELADELMVLRRWLTDLQRDFAETRATVVQQANAERALAERVASIEDRLAAREQKGEPARGEPSKAEPPSADRAGSTRSNVSLGTDQVLKAMAGASAERRAEPAAAPVPPPAAKPAQRDSVPREAAKTAPIATGAISPPAAPIALGAAKVTPPPPARTLGIELSGGESLEALRLGWEQLTRQHAQVLAGLSPRYRTALQGEEQPLRLVAGPFASQADANRACAQLRSKQVACRVGAYTGNAL